MNRIDLLLGTLDEAIREKISTRETGVLFSGGVDSTVVAALVSRHSDPRLYTVGIEGAHDLEVARSTAETMGLDWTGLVIDEDEMRDYIKGMVPLFGTNPLTISFEMPLFIILGYAPEGQFFCGQGADELYGGYSRYKAMDGAERRTSMRNDLEALLVKGMQSERNVAERFGKVLVHPFLDPKVLKVSLDLPEDQLFRGEENKAILRDVGRALGLGDIASRKKKAAQYGSGIMNAMKSMAKREKRTLSEFVTAITEEKS